MTPIITAFADSPDQGRGLARDVRVRWALEELGQNYDVRLVRFDDVKSPAHLAVHPFGQIPTYQEGDLVLFESGAIVLHLAQNQPGLLPEDPAARARAISWMFAAVNNVEPPIAEFGAASVHERSRPWFEARQELIRARVRLRLDALARSLGDAEWLQTQFTAGDLMMIHVLRWLERSGILADYPALVAYVERGEKRPAFQRAFADQLLVFEQSQTAA